MAMETYGKLPRRILRIMFRITGHRLGGRLGIAAPRWTGKEAIIFNAAGLEESTLKNFIRPLFSGNVAHDFVNGNMLTSVQKKTLESPTSHDPPAFVGESSSGIETDRMQRRPIGSSLF
jgi:hypothetical protein